MSKKKKKNNWFIIVTIIAFCISFLLSLIAELLMPKVNIIISVLLLITFILIGIIFDIIGVAVTMADEEPLHAMNSKKIKAAKKAVSFKKNADKVSSFCNDVIGDICGVISGSAGIAVAITICKAFSLDEFWVKLFITAIIASLTIGGKAYCKRIAMKKNKEIVYMTAKILDKLRIK